VDKYVVTTIAIGAQIITMSSMKCLYTMQKLESGPYNNFKADTIFLVISNVTIMATTEFA
jgi:hypothetical protein